jgi:hypothetical protein
MQSLIVDNSLEQIAVLYLAQKKALSLGPFIVALVSPEAPCNVMSLSFHQWEVS